MLQTDFRNKYAADISSYCNFTTSLDYFYDLLRPDHLSFASIREMEH